MADFEVEISVGADLQTWTDTATPSRINPHPHHPHRYYRVLDAEDVVRFSVAAEGIGLQYTGAEPWDWQLAGRLIKWAWVEFFSGASPIAIPVQINRTAVVEFTGQAFKGRLGHHLLMAYRMDGGAVAIPFIVEDANQEDRLIGDPMAITDAVARVLL